jgi:hypothetical protein
MGLEIAHEPPFALIELLDTALSSSLDRIRSGSDLQTNEGCG